MIDNLLSISSIHLVKCSVKANSRNSTGNEEAA
jgi:hypothetical protein